MLRNTHLLAIAICIVILVLSWIHIKRLWRKRKFSRKKLLSGSTARLFHSRLSSLQDWQQACENAFGAQPITQLIQTELSEHFKHHTHLSLDEFHNLMMKHTPIVPLSWTQFIDHKPLLIFCLGVNGSGKTTTIAKLIHAIETGCQIPKQLCAVIGTDTFRAAAMEQLSQKLSRSGVSLYVPDSQVSKPSTALYQGLQQAIKDQRQLILVDTSGRLHTQSNLKHELKSLIQNGEKWANEFSRYPFPARTLLICDATHGQSVNAQIQQFSTLIPIDALMWTKWDCVHHKAALWESLTSHALPTLAFGTGENINDLSQLDSAAILYEMIS